MADLTLLGLDQGDYEHITLSGLLALKQAQLIVASTQHIPHLKGLLPLRKNSEFLVLSERQTLDSIAEQVLKVDAALEKGDSVLRIWVEGQEDEAAVRLELDYYRKAGIDYKTIPSRQVIIREALALKLPWLSPNKAGRIQLLLSAQIKGDQAFWGRLARSDATLALDLGDDQPHEVLERLLQAGAGMQRGVALVSHHPFRSPICWLTTLEEVETLWPQWYTDGATLLYIEPSRSQLRVVPTYASQVLLSQSF